MADGRADSALTISPAEAPVADAEEAALVAALCGGDEAAFALLVEQYHTAMVRVASHFVCGNAAAEDVVQDVWLVVIRGIGAFQGRSSLKTWIFRILTNRAKTAGQREGRSVSLAVWPGIDWPGSWSTSMPEESVLMRDAMDLVREAIEDLPKAQREVITLRDVHGCGATEVCERLELSQGNQRVLLHRARTRVRQHVRTHHEAREAHEAS